MVVGNLGGTTSCWLWRFRNGDARTRRGTSCDSGFELAVHEEVIIPLAQAARASPLVARRKDEVSSHMLIMLTVLWFELNVERSSQHVTCFLASQCAPVACQVKELGLS